jgi:hypothetical protein
MTSDRFTITLPKDIGAKIRKRAREQNQPVSRIIADDVQAAERERIRQLMIEGYIASREENLKIAEEFWPIAGETLPDDDWSEYEDRK